LYVPEQQSWLARPSARFDALTRGTRGDFVSTRYPRIRAAYAGAALVPALDRVDALAHSDRLIHLVLVRYLDVLEAALADQREHGAARPLLQRALEGVHEALDTFGLLEAEAAYRLN
jgi:hypothetical protein